MSSVRNSGRRPPHRKAVQLTLRCGAIFYFCLDLLKQTNAVPRIRITPKTVQEQL